MATVKQKAVAEKLVENGGNISKTMRDVGYSEAMAHNPQKLTKSKAWPELLEEYLPDSLLGEKHKALLNKQEYIAIGKKGEREVISTGEMDPYAVSRGLDMAYKLKGRYAAEKLQLTTPEDEFSDEQLQQEIILLENKMKKRVEAKKTENVPNDTV